MASSMSALLRVRKDILNTTFAIADHFGSSFSSFLPSFCRTLRFFDPVISKVFSKKILKLRLCNCVLGFEATLMLMLLLNYCSAKKQGSKKNTIRPIGLSNFEIVFTLLAKAVAIQM